MLCKCPSLLENRHLVTYRHSLLTGKFSAVFTVFTNCTALYFCKPKFGENDWHIKQGLNSNLNKRNCVLTPYAKWKVVRIVYRPAKILNSRIYSHWPPKPLIKAERGTTCTTIKRAPGIIPEITYQMVQKFGLSSLQTYQLLKKVSQSSQAKLLPLERTPNKKKKSGLTDLVQTGHYKTPTSLATQETHVWSLLYHWRNAGTHKHVLSL